MRPALSYGEEMRKALLLLILFARVAHAGLDTSGLYDASGNPINLGQSTMSGSLPVAIASNQSAIPVTATITGNSNVNVNDGSGNAITSNASNSNRELHITTPDTTTASTALGALNASVTIAMQGLSSAGFQINAGTLIGTIQAQSSIDGGTTWTNSSFFDTSNSAIINSVTFSSNNTQKIYSILPIGGASHVRVTVSAYTSGTANALLRASMVSGASGAITAAAFGTATITYPNTIANTAVQVLAANVNRKYAMIASPSTSITCQMGSSTGLSGTTGFTIGTGTYFEFKGDNLYTGSLFCIASSAKSLTVTEGTP